MSIMLLKYIIIPPPSLQYGKAVVERKILHVIQALEALTGLVKKIVLKKRAFSQETFTKILLSVEKLGYYGDKHGFKIAYIPLFDCALD